MTEIKHASAMQEFKSSKCIQRSEPPPKDHTSLLQISPPLASNTKRSSHLEAAAEEDRMAEEDRTVVVELELGSSDKNNLLNPQKLCSRC
jgi:hypothetical protein